METYKSITSGNTFNKDLLLYGLQLVFFLSVLLYFGKNLFVPLSFALLISCVLYPTCKWLENRKIHRSVAILLVLTALFLVTFAVFYLVFLQFGKFIQEWEVLKIKISETIQHAGQYLTEHYGFSVAEQQEWIKEMLESSRTSLLPFLKGTAYSVSVSSVLFLMIPIFSALILYYRDNLVSAIYMLFANEQKEKIRLILHDTILSYTSFIKGMLIIYLIVGVLNSLGLAIIGVPHPFLFGFIASILTFIPYVGIMVASLLPVAISWITFNSVLYPLAVLFVFGIVQILEAYIIFPLVVSNRLNINTFFTIVAIIAGGILWGASGMILFIPFLSILKLIADRTEKMKIISVLLSADNKPEIH